MLKNLKKAAAIVLSFAMAVQFGLADSYYVNAVEEPVEPQQEETTTTAPQEQEEVPTTEEETPQQQEEGQQPAVEEEQPAAEEAQPQPQPVEQAEVKVSYVKEDDTDLMESVTATYDVGYRLDQDTNAFKEAHEAFEFEYAFVNGNKENKITKDQVKASGLTVTSDMTSLTLVYKSTASQKDSKDKKVETANLSGEKEDDSDSEDEVAIASERKATTYKLYHYALIPGKAMDSSESADNTWFGIGVTSISGVRDPSSLEYGIQSNFTYKQEGVVKTLYPNITYKGKTYEYAATGTENADKEGYYTLIPARVNIADGANAGNNRYNPTASGKTYHQDYTMVMNEKSVYTVTYNVMDPGETTYGVLNDYSQRVDAGTSESKLNKPTLKDVPSVRTDSAGNKYKFDGWYKDSGCTEKAYFNGKVNANTNYYGKYVAETYTVKYDSNGGTLVADKTLKYNDVVDTSQTPTKEGYIFVGWYYGSTKVTNQKYATLAKSESKKEIILEAHWKENLKASAEPVVKTYDGNAYGVNVKTNVKDATIRYWNKNTNKYDLTESPTKTNVTRDTDGNIKSLTVKYEVSKKGYKTVYGEATVTITPRQVTLRSSDAKKEYDGTALTKDEVKVTSGSFADKEGYTATTSGSQTLVGTSANKFNYELNKGTKAANYEIKTVNGTLEVTAVTDEHKHEAVVQAPSNEDTYDGTEKSAGTELTGTTFPWKGQTYRIEGLTSANVTKTDAGEYENKVNGTAKVLDTAGNDVTAQFKVTKKSGKLTIKKRQVTLRSSDAKKEYDGTALTKDEVKVTSGSFADKEGYTATTSGSQTLVGTSANKFNYELNKGTKAANYEIKTVNGTLEVTAVTDEHKHEAVVQAPSNEDTYDGTEKSAGTELTGTTFPWKGQTYRIEGLTSANVTKTDAGEYENKVNGTAKVLDTAGNDVTAQFKVTKKSGKLVINPKEYTVTTDSATKTYSGTALTAGGKVEGIVSGETVEFTTTGSQTEVGTSKNTYELVWKSAKATNYTLAKESIGILKVKKQSIDPGTDPEKPNPDYTGAKVNSPSDKVYDGKEHKWIPTVTDKADKKLKAGTDYTVEYSTSDFTNVGTIRVTITGKGNYSGTVKRSYKVTPKEYTVTTDSATKTYSGTALTAGGKVEGIVSGETVEFTTTGSQTEVGTSKNTYELVWKSAKATNYTLVKESIGTLTVKAKSIVPDGPDTPDEKKTGITVSEPSDSKYDGKVHREVLTVTDTKTGKELVAGTDYSVTYSSDLVNAGTVKVTVAGLGNYSGSFTKTYKITKRSVTLTSATVSKVYDGSALTNTSITVSGDGFVEGEGASYEVTGTQTEVGNSANSFEYKLNEKTLASNYNITKVVGTLTITAAPAPVTPATPSTPSSTTSTTPRTPSAPQVTTPAETVEKETTPKAEPKKEEKVEEEYTPKASPQYYWALINLICAILTVLFGLLLLISKRHKDEDDDEEDDETKQQTNNDDEENEQEKKRGLFTRVLAVLIAIVSVVFFLVTEDLSLPWTWTDQWTIWMVVIGLVQIVVFFVGRKWKNVDNDDEDEEAQQA